MGELSRTGECAVHLDLEVRALLQREAVEQLRMQPCEAGIQEAGPRRLSSELEAPDRGITDEIRDLALPFDDQAEARRDLHAGQRGERPFPAVMAVELAQVEVEERVPVGEQDVVSGEQRSDGREARANGWNLTMLIVDAKDPGYSYAPIYTVADIETNVTYYENIRVPQHRVLGEVNGGWAVLGYALGTLIGTLIFRYWGAIL